MGDANGRGSGVVDESAGEQGRRAQALAAAAAKVEAAAVAVRAIATEARAEDRYVVLGDVEQEFLDAAQRLQAAVTGLRAAGTTEKVDDQVQGAGAGTEAGEVVDSSAGVTGARFKPLALLDAEHLVLLKQYPVLERAREEWLRREKDLSKKVSLRQTTSGDVTSQIFSIIWGLAVFLGVVLSAVSQLSQSATANSVPLCGKMWFPLLLTGYGTLVTVCGVINKFTVLKSLELTILTDKQAVAELQRRVFSLQHKGPEKFCFIRDTRDGLPPAAPKSFWIGKILMLLAVLILAAVFIVSYSAILCDTWTVRKWDNGI